MAALHISRVKSASKSSVFQCKSVPAIFRLCLARLDCDKIRRRDSALAKRDYALLRKGYMANLIFTPKNLF